MPQPHIANDHSSRDCPKAATASHTAWRPADNPSEAERFATDPVGPLRNNANAAELPALADVRYAILNLDETLTKG